MLVEGGMMNDLIRKVGRTIQAIREVWRIHATSSNDTISFGEFVQSPKGALMP